MAQSFEHVIETCKLSMAKCRQVIDKTKDTVSTCINHQGRCSSKMHEDASIILDCIQACEKLIDACNEYLKVEPCTTGACAILLLECIQSSKNCIDVCQKAHDLCAKTSEQKCLKHLKLNDSMCNDHIAICNKVIKYYNNNIETFLAKEYKNF